MAEEKTISSDLIYEGRAVKLRVDTVKMPNDRTTTREIVEHSDCVAIIALDDEDNVLLVSQFRKPVEKELLEIPAGGVEPGEDIEDCVRRELREETGFLPQKIERLGGFYSSPGYCTEYLHFFLATDLTHSPLQAEDSENIKLVRVKLSEVLGLINSGDICDAKSIAALLFFFEHRKSAKGA